MDEIRLIEVWIIAMLGAVVALGFLYARRVEGGLASRYWAWAWFSFFFALFASAVPVAPAQVVAHGFGTAFPAFLLAGALAFAARPIPPALIPGGIAIGLLRGLADVAGLEWLADAGVILAEAPMDFVGAWVLWGAAVSDRRIPAVRALALMYAVFGVLEVTNLVFFAHRQDGIFWYFALGGLATLLLANMQLLVVIERARIDHGRDLQLLRDIALTGMIERNVQGVVARSIDFLRDRLELDVGAIWLLRPGGHGLDCIHYFGFGARASMPDDLASTTVDRPLPQQVLSSGSPIFIDDIQSRDLPIHSWYADMGVHTGALLPLQTGGENLGIISLGRFEVDPFNRVERRILTVAVDELSLALQHVIALERSAQERRILSSVIEASPTGILIADRNRRVEILNATFAQHFGEPDPEPWIGKRIGSFGAGVASRVEDPDEFAQVFIDVDWDAPARTTPLALVKPEERELLLFSGPISAEAGEHLGRVWVTRDVTEERRLEDQLRQSQKMETLGTLAGGVAHDFNNQLMAILGNVRLLLAPWRSDAQATQAVRDIQRAAEHCADLTRSLLAFARRASLSMRPIDPSTVLEQLRSLLRPILPSTLHFEIDSADDLPAIHADPTQLQQILLNLVVNARDAVRADGRIRIDVRERRVEALTSDDARPGRYVEFSVSDDGTGMDTQTRRRVFDPFFTTKPLFERTGLGLAVVYGAVKAHEGWVEVDSSPGLGSTFRVLIPVASEAVPEARFEDALPISTGHETILLADDEDILRRIVRLTLERQGYRVIDARDGQEAIDAFIACRDEIDLVLLDMTMPKLDGLRVLEKIREVAPEIPAILTSGLPEPDGGLPGEELTAFLPKPYEFGTLFEQLRAMINASSSSS